MKTAERHDSWQHIGRAAGQFARSVARDAADFASRVEQHVGTLASEIGREWRGPGTAEAKPADDVWRVFEDVRGVLSAVIAHVDELITTAFAPPPAADDSWTRVTADHDGVCAGCGGPIAAGADAFARRTAGSHALRCAACGIPNPSR